jgi:hypothetical protein
MNEEEFCAILQSAGVSTTLKLKYQGKKGEIERRVASEGFDFKGKPRVRLKDSRAYFNPNWIGGYDKIISLKEETYLDNKPNENIPNIAGDAILFF